MPLPSSGAISLLAIANEFGGSAPHSLNEYYGVASGIPSSGQISMNQFYGASAVVTQSQFSDLYAANGSAYYVNEITFVNVTTWGIRWSGSDVVTKSSAAYNFPSYLNGWTNYSYYPSIKSNTPFPAHSGTIGGWRYFGRRGEVGSPFGDEYAQGTDWAANRTTGSSYPF